VRYLYVIVIIVNLLILVYIYIYIYIYHVRVVDLVHLKLAIASMENSEDTFEESALNVSFDELSIEG
jgi:hypothetical protein